MKYTLRYIAHPSCNQLRAFWKLQVRDILQSCHLGATNAQPLTMTTSNGFLNNGFAVATEVDDPEDEVLKLTAATLETKRRSGRDYNPLIRKSRSTAI